MARSTPGATRERIVEEAIHLFSTKGYDATSVADIQKACGLTPSSGALYKHFPSKRALLDEVVRRHVDRIAATRQEFEERMPHDYVETLRLAAELVWGSMTRNREVVRITLRDLDQFPELVDQLWDGVLGNVYREFAAVLRAEQNQGRVDIADPEATAAVLIASLTYFPILQGLIGRTPGDIDGDRFLAAWIDHAARTVMPRAQAT